MDIRVLRHFVVIAREENITHAAKRLHISQPSLSKQIKELEDELGKTLLIRGKRKVSLTEDGVLLFKRAQEVIELFDKMEKEVKSDHEITGEINIGGAPTKDILNIASLLRKEHPDIRFNFYMNEANDILERLDHGLLDFAVMIEPIDSMKYETISLHDHYHWGVFMPKNCDYSQLKSINASLLGQMPLIMHKRKELQHLIEEWGNYEPEELHISATYNMLSGNPLKYIESGLGYILATEDLIKDPDICFKPLEPSLEVHYVLVYKKYALMNRASEAFLDKIKRVY